VRGAMASEAAPAEGAAATAMEAESPRPPSIAVSTDGNLDHLLEVVDSWESGAVGVISPEAILEEEASRKGSLGGSPGKWTHMPVSLKKATEETQANSSIQFNFGSHILGGHKMVLLGSCEVARGIVEDCQSEEAIDQIVTNLLYKVLDADTLARKVVLVTSVDHVGIVDRAHLDDTLFRARTRQIIFHDLKTVASGKRRERFVVFVVKDEILRCDLFYALQGKSNWSADKIEWVKLALDTVTSAAANTAFDGTHEMTLTGNTDTFDVPSGAVVHRVKFLGSSLRKEDGDVDTKSAVVEYMALEDSEMAKQTKRKTVQHIIDYAHDAVFVGVRDGIRVIDGATTASLIGSGILPKWIIKCEHFDLESLLLDPSKAKLLRETSLKQGRRSPSPIRKKSSKSKLPREGGQAADEIRDTAVCIVWKDERVDLTKVEILIVKGTLTKAARLVADINHLMTSAQEQLNDPFAPTSFPPKEQKSDVLRKAEIDRSTILKVQEIGSGQFGEVFLANQHVDEDSDHDIQRAVKILRKGANAKQRKAFCVEAKIQLKLVHENVVQVTGVCMTQTPYLCVLEFLEYGDLKKVLEAAAKKDIEVGATEQTFFALQVASALEYMHSKRYVHMDVAARNVLVGEKSLVKLADFGLTKKYNEDKNTWEFKGSCTLPMLYTPPECFPPIVTTGKNTAPMKGSIHYGEATDMWSFGVYLWEILTYGAQPFGDRDLLEVLRSVNKGERLEPPASSDAVLRDLVKQTHATDSEERPSFTEVHRGLLAHFKELSSGTGVVDVGALVNKKRARNTKRMSLLFAATKRASKMGLEVEDIAKVHERVVRSLSIADDGGEAVAVKAEAADQPDGPPKRPLSKWSTVRAVMPFYLGAVRRQMARVSRTSSFEDMLSGPLEALYENPFDSDDSELDIDAALEQCSDDEDTDVNRTVNTGAVAKQGAGGIPEDSTAEAAAVRQTAKDCEGEGDQATAIDAADVGNPNEVAAAAAPAAEAAAVKCTEEAELVFSESEESDEVDEYVDNGEVSASDMQLLDMLARNKEKYAAEAAARQAELADAFGKQKAEEDRIRAEERAQIAAQKAHEKAQKEAEKQRIYEEAQERLEKELTFSFSWGD